MVRGCKNPSGDTDIFKNRWPPEIKGYKSDGATGTRMTGELRYVNPAEDVRSIGGRDVDSSL